MKSDIRNAPEIGRSFDRVLDEAEHIHLREADFRRGFSHGAARMLEAIQAGVDPEAFLNAIDDWRDPPRGGYRRGDFPPHWQTLLKGAGQ
jgi:hypothetical protein